MADLFDAVGDLEHRAYNEGVEAGREAARNGDMRDAGVMSGIVKGFELGLEIGFMRSLNVDSKQNETVAEKEESTSKRSEGQGEVEPKDISPMDETINAMNSADFSGRPRDAVKSIGSRLEKRRAMLTKRLQEVPEENAREFDFKGEIGSLRSLYRSCNPPSGHLVRTGSDIERKITGNAETW